MRGKKVFGAVSFVQIAIRNFTLLKWGTKELVANSAV